MPLYHQPYRPGANTVAGRRYSLAPLPPPPLQALSLSIGDYLALEVPQVPETTTTTLRRTDGLSTALLTTHGLPLKPGRLFPGQLDQVKLSLAGVDTALAVKAFGGKHSDGSLRSVLVQYTALGATGTAAVWTFGQRRTLNATFQDGNDLPVPVAHCWPSDAAYLCATKIGGSMIPLSSRSAGVGTSDYGWAEDLLQAQLDADWQYNGPTVTGGNMNTYQEQWYTRLQWGCRSGQVSELEKGAQSSWTYFQFWKAGNYARLEYYKSYKSFAAFYHLTGYHEYADGVYLGMQGPQAGESIGKDGGGGNRDNAANYHLVLSAHMMNLPRGPLPTAASQPYPPQWRPNRAASTLENLLAYQHTAAENPAWDGMFGGRYYGDQTVTDPTNQHYLGSKAYMDQLLMTAAMRHYDEVGPDARILTMLTKYVDWTWTNMYSGGMSGGWKAILYVNEPNNGEIPVDSRPGGAHLPDPSNVNLNPFMIWVMIWLWHRTGRSNATLKANADLLMNGLKTQTTLADTYVLSPASKITAGWCRKLLDDRYWEWPRVMSFLDGGAAL